MSATLPKLLTADEFWRSPLNGKGVELVRGEVESSMPPGGLHGAIQVRLGGRLDAWASANNAGWVGVESGFLIATNPDTVRGPDIAFVKADRIPSSGVPTAFWRLPPDIAIEVVSPDETAQSLQVKISEYLDAGTSEVWVIYSLSREVVAHFPNRTARTLTDVQMLTSALLPGFSCQVAELFR